MYVNVCWLNTHDYMSNFHFNELYISITHIKNRAGKRKYLLLMYHYAASPIIKHVCNCRIKMKK